MKVILLSYLQVVVCEMAVSSVGKGVQDGGREAMNSKSIETDTALEEKQEL